LPEITDLHSRRYYHREESPPRTPGRPKFGNMLERGIEDGEASGILAWHPDRLARNSIDGGQVIYLLDQTRLTSLKFPTFWFENTSQGKFMLSIAFGQSKYYVDNLSENTKRGLRQKVRRGEYPSRAPLGYINDLRNKSIVVDKRITPIVIEAFELYAQNQSRYEDIADFLATHGLITRGKGTKYKKDRIRRLLSNPFYYGHFLYKGEVYEGTHEPIISKKLFDKVQAVLVERGRPRKANHSEPKVYCGLLRCYSCGLMITAEKRIKHQKNGNRHEYIYYHCTKKRKDMKCLEATVREEALDESLTGLLQEYALLDNWKMDLLARLEQDEQDERSSTHAFVASAQTRIASLQNKLQKLLDSYLDQDIDRDTYLDKKAELMSEKKSLEEQSSKLTLAATAWVEPMRQLLSLRHVRNCLQRRL
jgi:site-specific DNA recombinase